METEKFEALGQRGEACIIVRRQVTLPTGETADAFTLATGEKLRPTEVVGEFTTTDGARTYRLRT